MMSFAFRPLRLLLLGLLAAAPLLAPFAARAQEMAPEERAVLRAEMRKYLLEHPEVVMEALRVLENRRKQASAEAESNIVAANADALFADGYSYVAGNPEGDVTVVEFMDYNCGYCKRAHGDVKTLLETDPGVRLVIKEFPILGPSSRTASEAALAALEQNGGDRYLAFSDALMSNRGTLEEETIWRLAEEAGLDLDKLRADAASDLVRDRIARNYAVARTLKIEGTPTFVIGDKIVRGFVPLKELRRQIAAQRERNG